MSRKDNLSNERKDVRNLISWLGAENVTTNSSSAGIVAKYPNMSSCFFILDIPLHICQTEWLDCELEPMVSKMLLAWTYPEILSISGRTRTQSAFPTKVDAGELSNSTKECMVRSVQQIPVWKRWYRLAGSLSLQTRTRPICEFGKEWAVTSVTLSKNGKSSKSDESQPIVMS